MRVLKKSLRRLPSGYYIYYVNKDAQKWLYYLEATEDTVYILKAYNTHPYQPQRDVRIVYMHSERRKTTLTSGEPDGILFEIDEGKYMLELAEEL